MHELVGEQLLKLIEVRRCGVGDGVEFHSLLAPIDPLVALNRAGARSRVLFRSWPNENIHDMFATAVYQRRNGAVVDHIETPALQRITLFGKIADWRSKVYLPVEPWFHGVLIGGDDIFQVSWLQRSQVGIDNLAGHHGFAAVGSVESSDSPSAVNQQQKCGCDS